MATYESEQRMVRRHLQRWRAAMEPEIQAAVQAWRREQQRRLRRHPYRHVPPAILRLYCRWWGAEMGGRPPQERRCTKRLGTRYCWDWRVNGTTRCHRHQLREKSSTP